MQFAGPDARLLPSDVTHQIQPDLRLPLALHHRLLSLVIRLPAYPYEATSLVHRQSGNLPRPDDVRKGFFGRFTSFTARVTSSMASNSSALSFVSLSSISNA